MYKNDGIRKKGAQQMIQLSENWRLTADEVQFILQKKNIRVDCVYEKLVKLAGEWQRNIERGTENE